MTRDELREKVAYGICKSLNGNQHHNLKYLFDKEKYVDAADAALDTIFSALKEPTEEMTYAGGKSDVLLSAIIDLQGNYTSKEDVASDIWELMLSASTLAPKEK